MAFALIRPETMPVLELDPAELGSWEAERAAATVRGDLERFSRWGLSVAAFVAVEFGVLVLAGMVDAVIAFGAAGPIDVAVLLIAALLAVGGAVMLGALWRSGRRLARAAQRFLRRAHEASGQPRTAVGWIRPRIVTYELRVFLRIATASFALLLGIGGVAIFGRDLSEGLGWFSAGALVMGLVGLAAGCGQLGGVLRVVSGLAAADPVWAAIRGADRD